ncbi:MAG: hypothetical protein COT00_03925 [Candidatus Omnitrophica bacterium CG07_land_8_20_14_0_80_50_8]|nr:MAG: hypothetical protein COT00_03925 [Candidatus Omnitrophica bacterium CG07_land_8_20_14_0_80_50_8]
MPIFEYQCATCKHVTAFLESRAVRTRHACEKCGSKETVKVFSVFATQTKASKKLECSATCANTACPNFQ